MHYNKYEQPLAFGIGLATVDADNHYLDAYFPAPNFQSNFKTAEIIAKTVGYTHGTQSYRLTHDQLRNMLTHFKLFENDEKKHPDIDLIKNCLNTHTQKIIVASFIAPEKNDPGPQTVIDAYLRLHLLSHRLVKPHGIQLNGIFNVLPSVAWTSEGPIALKELPQRQFQAFSDGKPLVIHSVDKFPRMVDYVVPSGVRIADASRVRLGAYLGEGTTVMHEGFVNFNAGCEGPNMIEGRISSGVFVKKGSDLGGGCSTMGTLSGGGNIIISVGENCLLGANSGLGIPLGDRCTIEAGLYITANMKILCNGQLIKAKELSGKNDILFRRHSQTGQVEAIQKANAQMLNAVLHRN